MHSQAEYNTREEPTLSGFSKLHLNSCNPLVSRDFYRLLKSSFSEKVTKIWKNLPLVLMLLSKNNCFVKTGGRCFQILWPSHNVGTLNINKHKEKVISWDHSDTKIQLRLHKISILLCKRSLTLGILLHNSIRKCDEVSVPIFVVGFLKVFAPLKGQ